MTTLELFDTRNTSTTTNSVGVVGARKYARQFTKNGKYYRIMVRTDKAYEEYQDGKLVSWSYPTGCTPKTPELAQYGY